MIIPIAKRTHQRYKIHHWGQAFWNKKTLFHSSKEWEWFNERPHTSLGTTFFRNVVPSVLISSQQELKKMAKAKCQWQQQQQPPTKEQESYFKFIAADRLATSWLEGKWNNWNLNESCKVTLHGEKKYRAREIRTLLAKFQKNFFIALSWDAIKS